jgi:hypothetical protein
MRWGRSLFVNNAAIPKESRGLARIGILVISDRASRGEYDDKSGTAINEFLNRSDPVELIPCCLDLIGARPTEVNPMSVMPSALAHEPLPREVLPVAAIVYANEAYPDAVFSTLIGRCRALGLSLAGVLQHQVSEAADRRCDVVLEDLTSGHRTALFEDRGAGARGCRLDEAALAAASARVEGSLEKAPRLLVLNKFGKAECEGGGLLDLIASAIDRGIPVVIGVPRRNLGSWREFAGEFAIELSDDAREVELWLEGLRSVSLGVRGSGSS